MLEVRDAVREDAADIHKFIRELAEFEELAHEHTGTLQDLEESLFTRKEANVIMAILNGESVGFGLYFYNYSTFLAKRGIYVEDLYVTKDARGKGIGTAILKNITTKAVELGLGRVEWSALNWNSPAIGFYEKTVNARKMSEWVSFRLEGAAIADFASK